MLIHVNTTFKFSRNLIVNLSLTTEICNCNSKRAMSYLNILWDIKKMAFKFIHELKNETSPVII